MSNHIIMVAVYTLALVIVSVVAVMLYGLFDQRIDNSEIFKIIGPAFSMIVGTFAGLIGGYLKGRSDGAAQTAPSPPSAM